MFRIGLRRAKSGGNIIVERQWQVREDQWVKVEYYLTPRVEEAPASMKWAPKLLPATETCKDAECAERNHYPHFDTDPNCINYGFKEMLAAESAAAFAEEYFPTLVLGGPCC